ncbi:MAG TPA: hypothetical protein VGM92_03650 [Candidatus Kapabacteria bacterium]
MTIWFASLLVTGTEQLGRRRDLSHGGGHHFFFVLFGATVEWRILDRLWGALVGALIGSIFGVFVSISISSQWPGQPFKNGSSQQAEEHAFMWRGTCIGAISCASLLIIADMLRAKKRGVTKTFVIRTFMARCLECEKEMEVNLIHVGKTTTCIHCGVPMAITSRPPL